MPHHNTSDKLQRAPGDSLWRRLASVGLGCAVVATAVYFGPDLWQTLARLDWVWALIGLLCYALNYMLRAGRVAVLSKGRVPYWPDAFYASCLHGFATYMLPFRSGELVLPVLLRGMSGLALLEGTAILISARLLDLMVLGLCIMSTVAIGQLPIDTGLRMAWFGIGLGLTALTLAVRLRLGISWLQHRWPRAFGYLAGFVTFGLPEVLLSLGIWVAVAGCFLCVARSLALPLGMAEVWLLISIQLPLQMIPVQGIANAGNHEAGWLAGLTLLGLSASRAIEIAMASHVLLLSYVLLLGPMGLVAGFFRRRAR